MSKNERSKASQIHPSVSYRPKLKIGVKLSQIFRSIPSDWYQSWITQDWPPLIIGSASRFGKECHLLLSNEHSKNSQHFRSQMSTHFKNVGYRIFKRLIFRKKWINNAFLFSIFDSFKVPIPFLYVWLIISFVRSLLMKLTWNYKSRKRTDFG